MFIPDNYLKLLSLVFDYSGMTKGTLRNEKLGFKEHSSLERHQKAYIHSLKLFTENLAQSHPLPLLKYASSLQRFVNELNSPPFETYVNKSEGDNIYWIYLYAPMIAALLHKYSDRKYEGNAIHFFGKFLISKYEASSHWPLKPAEKSRWAKYVIKSQNKLITPKFTARINDIRGNSIRSIATIKNDISILKEDLKELGDKSIHVDEHSLKVKSAYIAAMIIRRLEDNGVLIHLKLVAEYLVNFDNMNYNKYRLLSLHKDICHVLLCGDDYYNRWQKEDGIKLILQVDNYLGSLISPTYPAICSNIAENNCDEVWPKFDILHQELEKHDYFTLLYEYNPEQSLLSEALLDYYKMFYFTEKEEFDIAFSYCTKVESVIGKVHLGKFLAATLVHKIILHWLVYSSMKHNQFNAVIMTIALYIEDEHIFYPVMNPAFVKYLEDLSDGEMMMFNVFRLFNEKHPNIIVNPLRPISDAISLAINICEGSDSSVQELLPIFQKQFDSKYKRTSSVLPFCRLTLSQSVDMLPELFAFLGVNINHEYLNQFQSNIKFKLLIQAYDSKIDGKNIKSNHEK
ncbi:hypothetical protein [Pseudoalteromonas sp. NGC95]|uniref:hypothetical protein n=1 Tax=Pseudoalteromonas sp. NGC95 TaxID=2792051 RepID=UPI0018CF463E|nr:hypothetical protein [Pseudoalteromonas sp. NGC95]MBH0018720.1 hypothetical protein [Pseudoalteromonas sp. NGC95]